jgi:hypothetical protein
MVGGGMKTRRGRRSTHRMAKEAQQDNDVQQQWSRRPLSMRLKVA